MAYRIRKHPRFRPDVVKVLAYTEKEFGKKKKEEYKALLKEAQHFLRKTPERGIEKPEVHPLARIHRIAKPGRDAAHVILYVYRPTGVVLLVRFLHERSDFPRHLPNEEEVLALLRSQQ